MKIYWLTRYGILPSQIKELRRLFGDDVVVIEDFQPPSDADDVIRRFKESGADELVIAGWPHLIVQIVQQGIKPLWAEMQ